MKRIFLILLQIASCVISCSTDARLIEYDLIIDKKVVNFTGKNIIALAINDQIPAPTLEATVGDTLRINVHNRLAEDSSLHWHGVLLPNDQDGVPYLTTLPIKPNTTLTYQFPIQHAGTYWYHSHSGLQEQRGLYGALVFHPKSGERIATSKDHVLVFSDWTNEHPKYVLANIKKDDHYYALKKNSVQSWVKVFQHGQAAIQSRLQGAWTRMGSMDLSDVGYDAFLVNGHKRQEINAVPGEKIRLRLINAAASSYFYVEFSGGPMEIVAADGVDIESILVQRLKIAIAETYDVIVTIPKEGLYELRASVEDGTGYSSTFIGKLGDTEVKAPEIPKPNLFVMEHMGHEVHQTQPDVLDHNAHHLNHMSHRVDPVIENMTDYHALKAIEVTSLPKGSPSREVMIHLDGAMERYIWSFNNKTLKNAQPIKIAHGENLKFILNNRTMMHHPIHLHGHFFRVLNGQNEKSPLKHTVNVAPMEKIQIEFAAHAEKDWFFHCHNLYHMMSGMAQVISYKDTSQFNKEIHDKIAHDPWYHKLDLAFLSQMSFGSLNISNEHHGFEIEYDTNYDDAYDVDLLYLRNLSRFFDLYVGGNFEKEVHEKHQNTAIAGFRYILPMLLEFEFRINSKRHLRAALGSDLQLTDRLLFEWSCNTDKEYQTTWSYEWTKFFLLTATYDSDHRWGGGIRLRL